MKLGAIDFFLLFIILSNSSVGRAQEIKIYLDKTYKNYIFAEQQDCSVHETKDRGLTLGFKVGGLFWAIGPEISYIEKTGIEWHRTTQGLISRYQELCAHFNTGSITKTEYDMRLAEIEKIEKKAYDSYHNYLKRKEKYKSKFFDDLDKEVLNKNKSIK